MIEAELKGKLPSLENREDIITSTVFGLLKYTVMKKILTAYIGKAVLYRNIKTSIKQKYPLEYLFNNKVVFKFWENYAGYGQPDLVIEGKEFVFVVEAKYGADLSGDDQLARYNQILEKEYMGKHYKAIIYLTADLSKPRIQKQSLAGFDSTFYWLTWYHLFDVLKEHVIDRGSSAEIYQDLVEYCKYRGFELFSGISDRGDINFDANIFWDDTIPLMGDHEYAYKDSKIFWMEG